MANTYKNNVSTITSTGSDEAIYTCPSDATAIVNTIFVYNGSGEALILLSVCMILQPRLQRRSTSNQAYLIWKQIQF